MTDTEREAQIREAWPEPDKGIVVTVGAAHIRHIDRTSTRRLRQLVQGAVTEACNKARRQGARPVSAVDDLSYHAPGRWIDTFGFCLRRAALRERISISGGEMAQMADTYAPGCVSVVIFLAALR